MKKVLTVLIVAAICVTVFAACGYSNNLTISIGDGSVPDDGVSVQVKYNETWNDGDVVFSAKFGHESGAVLADEYTLAFSTADPVFSDSYTMTAITKIDKASLEPNTAGAGKVTGSATEITIPDLSQYLPEGEGVCTVYLVFYSSDTDFDDITTFASHEFEYEWVSDTQIKLV